MPRDVDKISPTALLIAHFRSFTDIPFAREVADATNAREASLALLGGDDVSLEALTRENAPQAEARFKCITSAIVRSGVRQVLELGAGLSFRGFGLEPSLRYVATDLPLLVDVCRSLVESVASMRRVAAGRDLRFQPLDVRSRAGFAEVAAWLEPVPLTVVNEGLLGYLSFDEKAAVAQNVRELLARFGGVWITPDLSTREQVARAERPTTRHAHAAVTRSTERSFSDYAFENERGISDFFANLGFAVETLPQLDGSFTLSSLVRLGLPAGHAKAFEADLQLRVLRLR